MRAAALVFLLISQVIALEPEEIITFDFSGTESDEQVSAEPVSSNSFEFTHSKTNALGKDAKIMHPRFNLTPEEKGVQQDIEKLLRNVIDSQIMPNRTNILVSFIIWNEGVVSENDESMWRLSTHPLVGGVLKIIMSSLHRARNHGIQHLFSSSHKGVFSHILFVNQDVVFERSDIDKLIAAKKEIIGGLSVHRFPPYQPYFIPLNGVTDSWEWLQDIVYGPPENVKEFEVDAMGFEFALVEIPVLQRIVNIYGNKLEWFWLSGNDGYLKDEDLTFCRGARQHGVQLFVHPGARIQRVQPMRQGFDFYWNKKHGDTMRKELSLVQPTGFPVVVENKLDGLRLNLSYNVLARDRTANVVILNAVWASFNPAAHASLWHLAQHPDVVGRITITHSEVVEARNMLLRAVFDNFPDFSHVLFIDADMTFTVEDYTRLQRADVGLIFGLAVKRLIDDHPPAYMPLSGDPSDHTALLEALSKEILQPIEVKGGGMAFTLIKKEVLDVTYRYRPDGLKEWFWCHHYVDKDSKMKHHLSEDYSFGHRARAQGYPVYLHSGVQIGHVDDETLTIQDFIEGLNLNFVKGAFTT